MQCASMSIQWPPSHRIVCPISGLSIGETTWGGTFGGKQPGAIMDYGSLIWVRGMAF